MCVSPSQVDAAVAFGARLDLSRGGRHVRSSDSVPYCRFADCSACLTFEGFCTLGVEK